MPSFSQKIASLVDTYQHSKTSPAYRELSVKYKTLKSTNQELIHLLTNVLSRTLETDKKPRRRLRRRNIRRSSSETPIHYEEVVIKEEPDIVSTKQTRYAYASRVTPETIVIEDDSYEEVVGEEADKVVGEDKEEVVAAIQDDAVEVEVVVEINDDAVDEVVVEEDVDVTEEVVVEEEVKEEVVFAEEDVEVVEEEEDEVVEEEVVEEEDVEVEVVEEEEDEVVEEEVVEEEVVEEEVEEVVEEEVVEEEVEGVVEEEVVEEEEEETGVYEIEIDGTRYYTTGEQNGVVYALLEDDDVGDEVGNFVNGKFVLNK